MASTVPRQMVFGFRSWPNFQSHTPVTVFHSSKTPAWFNMGEGLYSNKPGGDHWGLS